MKITSTISRILLGLLFLVFGLNGFLQFLKMPPPTGAAGQFFGALFVSHELAVIMALQVIGGVILLANRFIPLGLLILGPIIVNIVLFHAFMAPSGIPQAALATILWVLTALGVPGFFTFIFQAKPNPA
jgi:hypothetical protein